MLIEKAYEYTSISKSPRETTRLGRALGSLLQAGDVVCLVGDLGSGKTCLAQGIAQGLEIDPSQGVTSPTFTLIHEFLGRLPLYHFDLYRLGGPDELWDLGPEEYFYGQGVTVIEWAEKARGIVPGERLDIELKHYREKEREIKITAFGARFQALLKELLKKPFIRRMKRLCQEE